MSTPHRISAMWLTAQNMLFLEKLILMVIGLCDAV